MTHRRSLTLIVILTGVIFFVSSCNKISSPDNTPITNVTITSLRPTHGPFDTIDTLTGKGFDQIPVFDSVLLNGQKLTVISRSDEQVIVKIPSLAGTGNIDIWYQGKEILGPVFTYDSILMVTTVAGVGPEAGEVNGKGIDARFWGPAGIAVDSLGNLYVCESGGSCIRKIDAEGNVTTLAGPAAPVADYVNGTGSVARFSSPIGMCLAPDGNLYVADMFNYRVRKVTLAGEVSNFAGAQWDAIPYDGAFDGAPDIATFDSPYGVASDKMGNIYVVDNANNKIRKITPSGFVSSLAGGDYYHSGWDDGQGTLARFYSPDAIASDPAGNLFVVDDENHTIRKITPDGNVTTILGPHEPAITGPYDLFITGALATDKYGNLFFSIPGGIVKRTPDGTIIRYACGGIGETDGPAATVATYRYISGITVDQNGTLYITDNNRVRKIAWQ